MNTEARDKAITEIARLEFNLDGLPDEHNMNGRWACTLKTSLEQAYEAGYAACRDNAIRLLSARKEQDYDA